MKTETQTKIMVTGLILIICSIIGNCYVNVKNTKRLNQLTTYAEQTDEYINISKELSEKIYLYNEAVTEYNNNIEKGNKKQLEVPY